MRAVAAEWEHMAPQWARLFSGHAQIHDIDDGSAGVRAQREGERRGPQGYT